MSIINLHFADNLPAMKVMPDRAYDLAIIDPPYGNNSDFVRKDRHKGKLSHLNKQYHTSVFDQEPPPQEFFDELFRVSKHQIIWGINYFLSIRNLRIGPGRIVWDKCNPGTSYSDCEIAYCSTIDSVRIFRYMWNGFMQGRSLAEGHIKQGDTRKNEHRFHPTQKPKKLYSHLLQTYAKPGWKILDTHCGSGMMLHAALDLDFDVEAYEKDPVYYGDATREFELYRTQHKIPFALDHPKKVLKQAPDIFESNKFSTESTDPAPVPAYNESD